MINFYNRIINNIKLLINKVLEVSKHYPKFWIFASVFFTLIMGFNLKTLFDFNALTESLNNNPTKDIEQSESVDPTAMIDQKPKGYSKGFNIFMWTTGIVLASVGLLFFSFNFILGVILYYFQDELIALGELLKEIQEKNSKQDDDDLDASPNDSTVNPSPNKGKVNMEVLNIEQKLAEEKARIEKNMNEENKRHIEGIQKGLLLANQKLEEAILKRNADAGKEHIPMRGSLLNIFEGVFNQKMDPETTTTLEELEKGLSAIEASASTSKEIQDKLR
nr:hypothetical protein [Oedogonium sp. 1_circle_61917]